MCRPCFIHILIISHKLAPHVACAAHHEVYVAPNIFGWCSSKSLPLCRLTFGQYSGLQSSLQLLITFDPPLQTWKICWKSHQRGLHLSLGCHHFSHAGLESIVKSLKDLEANMNALDAATQNKIKTSDASVQSTFANISQSFQDLVSFKSLRLSPFKYRQLSIRNEKRCTNANSKTCCHWSQPGT